MEDALRSGVDAAILAIFVGAALHWGTSALFGRLPRLVSYVVGVLGVGLCFTHWAIRTSLNIGTEKSCAVWWMIVCGVGVGVGAGYLLDYLGGVVRENCILRNRVDGDDIHG